MSNQIVVQIDHKNRGPYGLIATERISWFAEREISNACECDVF
jgi:hypothetical protein